MNLQRAVGAGLNDRVLGPVGLSVARTPERGDVLELLGMLAPVAVETPLIRLGGDADGGYLVPDLLDGIEANFCAGVSDDVRFERALLDRGIRSFLADPSVPGPPDYYPSDTFRRIAIGGVSGEQTLTLADWLRLESPDGSRELMLSMDIEGAEYESILAAGPATLERFRVIVIELHHLDHAVRSELGLRLVRAAVAALRAGHDVVHAHPNPSPGYARVHGLTVPSCLELTLLRREHVRPTGRPVTLPHPLDRPNLPGQSWKPLPWLTT